MSESELESTPLVLKVKRLVPTAVLPTKAHPGDAAYDLRASHGRVIRAGCRAAVATGLAMEIPPGWYMQVFGRSGLATNHGVVVLAGVLDSSYRGEVMVIALNTGVEKLVVNPGDKIAQGVLIRVPECEVFETGDLSTSDRGEGGFGSSGR